MVIKVYMTNLPSNSELRKNQNHVISTLESLRIEVETIDISDPCKEEDKKMMRANSRPRKEGQTPLPPQIFNEDAYCGDYYTFADFLEIDQLYEFLKLPRPKDSYDERILQQATE